MMLFVSNFFAYVAEAIIIAQYASHMFKEKTTYSQKLAILGGLYTVIFLFSLYDNTALNLFLFTIANFLFLFTQYQLHWYNACFHSALYTALMAMSELLLFGLITYSISDSYFGANYMTNRIVLAVFSKLLLAFFVYLIIHITKGLQKADPQDKTSLLLLFIPLVSTFVMYSFIRIDSASSSPDNEWMITLNAVLLLLMNLLTFGINQHMQRKNAEYMQLQLLRQKESSTLELYQILLQQQKNQRILIHDIKNHFDMISRMAKEHQEEQIISYIEQLVQSSDLKSPAQFCDHAQLNLILSRYKHACDEKNIHFYTDIRSGSTNFIEDADLTSLFCNLLDNALQAASLVATSSTNDPSEHYPDPHIEVTATNRKDSTLSVSFITVVNSCKTNPFTTTGKLITNKRNSQEHGFGIKSIRKIVEKYNGNIKMYYEESTQTFHTVLSLTFRNI